MIHFHVITIFPQMFDSYLGESILKKAVEKKLLKFSFYNPKDFSPISKNPELKTPIDGRPVGGGPGMVLKAEPFLKAILKAVGKKKSYKIFYMSPRGKTFDTQMAKNIAQKINSKDKKKKLKNIILVSGRYEGIDSRVEEVFPGENISVGDYVLTGGELPAMIMIDSISRQVSGVLGNFNSLEEERVSAGKYYTKPNVIKWPKRGKNAKNYKVPDVLLSGNHKKIEEWKKENS